MKRTPNPPGILALLIFTCVTTTLQAQTTLEMSKGIDARIAGGQAHEYRVSLQADEYAKVTIEQRSVGVSVSVSTSDGNELFTANYGSPGSAVLREFIAAAAGVYRLKVMAAEPNAPAGDYRITLSEVATATEVLRERVAGSRIFESGADLVHRRDRKSVLKGIAAYEESLPHWRAAKDPITEAMTLDTIGGAYSGIGEQQKALEYATQALPIAQATHDPGTEGWALESLGNIHNTFGDRRKAVEYSERALPLLRKAGSRSAEAYTLNDLGMAHAWMGELRLALEYFEKAKAIYTELQDRAWLAIVASNFGVTYGDLGEYKRALENYQGSLALHREIGNRKSEAITLNNIGTAYSSMADYQKGLDAFLAALAINRTLGNPREVAINLHNVAWAYFTLGDRRRALEMYQESLGILRKIGDKPNIANSLSNLGDTYSSLGDFKKAIEHHNEALELRRAVNDHDGEASSFTNLGRTYLKLERLDDARENLQKAVDILRETGSRRRLTAALRDLGTVYRLTQQPEESFRCLNESLEISRAILDRRSEADALTELARLERDRGDLAQAHKWANEALGAFESLRLTVASPTLRASFFATAREIQEMDIDVLMGLRAQKGSEQFGAEALLAAERGRARSLLELLGESGSEIRRGVDTALLDRERALETLISGKAEQQTRLLNRKHTDADAAAAAKELDSLTAELDQVQARIRTTSPEYESLTRPAPLSLNEVQSQVLDGDTVLLEYALGPKRSFLWAVTPSSLDIFELPGRADVEAAAKRAYELLTARNQNPAGESAAARSTRVRKADEAYIEAAEKVSAMLLGPAAQRIAGKRLLIVGEGVLQYLPFGALPEPGEGKRTPLIVSHEIVTAPSASVVSVLRRDTAGRKAAPKSVAIVADPVFSTTDPRIASMRHAPADAHRSSGDVDAQEFLRLRFSRTEADEIARLAPAASTLKAVDFDASRDTVLRPELGQYRIVHFATHSLLNNEHPELSGVVLSLVDRAGHPQNGFLRLFDIYNLRLGADLVVLSACQTALGGEIRGEGLIGLTRGFLYAGAPRVVATLWEIDDRTTAELMKHFYEGILSRGERPAAALRAAQTAMFHTRGWDAPYYWAAFTIQGEWR